LPVERPDELVLVTSPPEFKGGRSSTNDSGDMDFIFSRRIFRDLEKQPGSGLTGLAGFRDLGANLAFGQQTISGSVRVVSGGYFPILGATPVLGRIITAEDAVPGGGNPVAASGRHSRRRR